jgi:hypothetical protein
MAATHLVARARALHFLQQRNDLLLGEPRLPHTQSSSPLRGVGDCQLVTGPLNWPTCGSSNDNGEWETPCEATRSVWARTVRKEGDWRLRTSTSGRLHPDTRCFLAYAKSAAII